MKTSNKTFWEVTGIQSSDFDDDYLKTITWMTDEFDRVIVCNGKVVNPILKGSLLDRNLNSEDK